ncbi:hypothetical protein RFI_01879 [Reticulomyxa filosa]|uniref:Uncharacterized protein n=1 Tax=Reticulomyxa filosa TaxID=46433 RepID=X6P9H6_RETFI|nr:hypothetical protein RFI_01879 [Reticulomyxa filosa]|eukprot:ETO35195.1 hypothetical protein RFI_01879 [Reticulomyxa filosa]
MNQAPNMPMMILFEILQRVTLKHETVICGNSGCYSYHSIKNEYKFICLYLKNIVLDWKCIAKLVDNNNKDNNEIMFLSFDKLITQRRILIMGNVSVWGNGNKTEQSLMNYNKWIPFANNHNNLIYIEKITMVYVQ